MGRFCPGEFCPRGDFVLEEFCPGGILSRGSFPGSFVRGDFALEPSDSPATAIGDVL